MIVSASVPLPPPWGVLCAPMQVEAPPDLPNVAVDRSQIERVIGNLVTNASRATATGGTISVTAALRGA